MTYLFLKVDWGVRVMIFGIMLCPGNRNVKLLRRRTCLNKVRLRRGSHNNSPLAVSQVHDQWIVQLNRMLFAVNGNDEIG
jgi:hypothetical protein